MYVYIIINLGRVRSTIFIEMSIQYMISRDKKYTYLTSNKCHIIESIEN